VEENIEFGFKNLRESVWLQEGQYLSDYNVDNLNFGNGLPEGIFNKKYPGMGATYCEFHAPRPSIIVFPFRKLAKEKEVSHETKNTFFVGTDLNNKSTSKFQIKDWYIRNKSKNPKFSVVADSIKKLVEALQEAGCNPYKEFFLVLDEVELLQMQSGFRKVLPLCFDYFKKFERKTLVSATLLNFSDEVLKNLPTYNLEVYTYKKDDEGNNYVKDKEPLEIRTFKMNPHWGVANQLVEYFKRSTTPTTKFFIGLNSLEGISEMIEIFEKGKINDKVSVHVSSDSKESFIKKYNKKEIVKGVLPTQINLTSCINFSGIDLNENIHAIAISLKRQVHHAFSFENLVQFFGRSRFPDNRPPYTFALSLKGSPNYKKPIVPLEKRKEDLNGLIDYVTTKIEEEKDREDMLKAISESKSNLIYQNPEGKSAVNWLLEDLENHEIGKVKDYKKKGEILITKLKERYNVEFSDYSKYWCSIIPNKKEEDHKEGQTLEAFLDNLDENYDSRKLVNRFLDEKSLQSKKAAAYWYLFGRVFLFKEVDCKKLADHYSKLNRPYQVSSIIVAGLRFYIRHFQAYQLLVESLVNKKNNQNNLNLSDILDILKGIDGYERHFKPIFDSITPNEGASILMEHFWGLSKFGGERPKFKVQVHDLKNPKLVNDYGRLENQLKLVSNLPKGSGLDFGQIKPENLIDTEF